MDTLKSQRTKSRSASSEAVWYNASQLAQRWGVTVMTIRRWHYAGRLRGRTLSRGVVRFSQSDVTAFEQES